MSEKINKIIKNLEDENKLLKPVQEQCETECEYSGDCEQKEVIDHRISENQKLIDLKNRTEKS